MQLPTSTGPVTWLVVPPSTECDGIISLGHHKSSLIDPECVRCVWRSHDPYGGAVRSVEWILEGFGGFRWIRGLLCAIVQYRLSGGSSEKYFEGECAIPQRQFFFIVSEVLESRSASDLVAF